MSSGSIFRWIEKQYLSSPSPSSPSRSHSQSPQPLYPWSEHSTDQWSYILFPRYFHALSTTATATGELFLFGGKSYSGISNLFTISTRDFSIRQLHSPESAPNPRYVHSAVLTSTALIIWGGMADLIDQTGQTQSNDDSFYRLDLGTSGRSHVKTRSS
jgi:hypothetical protein